MNNADIGWMLVSTALVLLMTPALAFFYGGLVRSKNALNTMMMSFVALGPVAVVWALVGYSLAFAPGSPAIGSLSYAGLRGVGMEAQGAIPHLLFMVFQGTFAIITPALISGAVVERMRFNAYLAFILLWVLIVYAPVAHWVWGGGFLATMGALDFAGGAVVHVNAATAALVAALVVGPRKDYGRHAMLPHNVPVCDARRRTALVRLVRVQCRQRRVGEPDGGAGIREYVPGAGGNARDVDADRSDARRTRDRGRRRDRDRGRPGGGHAGRRLHRARPRRSPWARSGRCRVISP